MPIRNYKRKKVSKGDEYDFGGKPLKASLQSLSKKKSKKLVSIRNKKKKKDTLHLESDQSETDKSESYNENSDVEYEDGAELDRESSEDVSKQIKSDDIFKLIDLYYTQPDILYSHQTASANQFMDETIPNILQNSDNIIFEKIEKNTKYVHYLRFKDVKIRPPIIESEDEPMFPTDARQKNMTYSAKVFATVAQYMDTIDIATGETETRMVGKEERVQPANIPVMLRSRYCNLTTRPDAEKAQHESPLDPGCYFIVNGNEKVIISLEKMCDNKFLVFLKKDPTGSIYTCQVISKSMDKEKAAQTISIRIQKNGKCMIKLPMFNEFPLYVLLRALGMETDKDIIDYIVRDKNDKDMINFVRTSMEKSRDDSKEKAKLGKIFSKNDAFEYLLSKLKYVKKYTDTDLDIQAEQKKRHLQKILESLLPHVRGDTWNKAFYFTSMMNKLCSCAIGRTKPDDRDSFFNKRVELPGPLLEQLLRQKYATLLNDCGKHLKNKLREDNEPVSIINQIKPSTIEQGIKKALSTGSWGSKTKKGVAEVLQRLTFLQTMSYFRRLKSPTADASTNKLTGPRHLHNTQAFFCCVGETPEGANTGMVKNMSLTCNITHSLPSQIGIVLKILNETKKLQNKRTVIIPLLKKFTTVFLNGDPVGLTDKPLEIYKELRQARTNKKIDKTVSISYNIRNKDIQIWTDGGRMIRPLLRVGEKNELILNKDHLDKISLDVESGSDHKNKKITSWNEFLMEHPDVIEYVDVEELDTMMVAMYPEMVYEQKKKMNYIPTDADIKNAELNRYDLSYVEYTHCELHPSLMLGMVTSNTPVCNHNHSPRIVYQYSQARQAMGIYITNYLDRMDLSYNLYYPERPLMVTKGMSYTRMIELPAGFNAIVAIMTYGGYNMEDSIIMNQSAIDRGFSRAVSYKKYSVELKKNAATSQDDIFMNPNMDQTSGMGDWNYKKLNDAGYVPKGTELVSKDVVVGKVTPVPQQGEKSKQYRDSSEVYKYNTPGMVDEVWANGLKNADDYPMIKIRVRSRRIAQIADKYCSRMAQKGTCGIVWRQQDMPWSVDSGLIPDMIVNTNAFPKRMTIGQQIEVVAEKVAALQGSTYDGTPFPYDYQDTTGIFKYLKKEGFNEHGLETMYCGLSGRKFQARIFIGPTYYLRLKHLVADKIHCLTEDHEVLTKKGWKQSYDLSMKDKVATLKDGKLEYEHPKKLLRFPDFEGNLYEINDKNISLKVTDEHRMLVKGSKKSAKNKKVGFKLKKVQDIDEISTQYLKDTPVKNKYMKIKQYNQKVVSKKLGDKISQKLIENGYACNLEKVSETKVKIHVLKSKDAQPKSKNNFDVNYSKEPVFCLQVPSETFYVRRHGKACWTGNSRSRGPLSSIVRQPLEGRSRDGGLRFGKKFAEVEGKTLC